MILNGTKLLFNPARYWEHIASSPKTAAWLLTASFTAATIPAIAVVSGHLGAGFLGYEPQQIAIQRAAIGLIATLVGALVMAPALALALLRLSHNARAALTPSRSISAAMGLLWPAWVCGAILAIPPLLNLGPEMGELLWATTAGIAVYRVLKKGAVPGLKVRRRWSNHFVFQSLIAFLLLFSVIAIGPALLMRIWLGVASTITYGAPNPIEWPVPPVPNW